MPRKFLSKLYQSLPKKIQQAILEFSVSRVMRIKKSVIEAFQKKYGYNVLIETGTFLGDMVEAQSNNFKKIYSIELQHKFAEKARERFKNKEHITILQGDSSKLLRVILSEINEPVIFWLDAHYSGGLTARGEKDCPIYAELDAIFESKFDHVLLIDDARYFNGSGDYPKIESLTEFVQTKDKRYKFAVGDDVIRYSV